MSIDRVRALCQTFKLKRVYKGSKERECLKFTLVRRGGVENC